jgi:hypothetical protein
MSANNHEPHYNPLYEFRRVDQDNNMYDLPDFAQFPSEHLYAVASIQSNMLIHLSENPLVTAWVKKNNPGDKNEQVAAAYLTAAAKHLPVDNSSRKIAPTPWFTGIRQFEVDTSQSADAVVWVRSILMDGSCSRKMVRYISSSHEHLFVFVGRRTGRVPLPTPPDLPIGDSRSFISIGRVVSHCTFNRAC